ncbi:short chain dehydrogenase [Lelliottia amnigena]|nr:short chain dehydrogenase [Lelliottia amnigena]
MKIVIIGASGTVGRAVTEALSRRHEVIRVGRTNGDEQVDITSQGERPGAVREDRSSGCDCLRQRWPAFWPSGDHERQ